MKSVRVRFAPSPTGHLHIGGLRTALFNWLFARHVGGSFLIRIEDTDQERSLSQFTDSIIDSLQWAGLSSDEPLLFQSQRFDLYKEAIENLVQKGKAYRCFCPSAPERIEQAYLKYDGKCRSLPIVSHEIRPHVIRFKFPLDKQEISFVDLVRGPISFSVDQFDDFIILRTDGIPVYNVCVVIDDHAQNITHVIRGEDHISNTPKQIALYEAFGFAVPHFAHLPLILGPSGQRLSKREAATAVLDYKKQGYLPGALCNYLVRLGWSHGDQEVFSRDELVRLFSLEHVGKSGSIFDEHKLQWMNGMYIRQETPQSLLEYMIHELKPIIMQEFSLWSKEQLLALLSLYQERVSTLHELLEELSALYHHQRTPTQEDLDAWVTPEALRHLKMLHAAFETLADFSSDSLKKFLKEFATQHSVKLVTVAQPLRLALTGKASGPGVFELLALLGKKESIKRIEHFLSIL